MFGYVVNSLIRKHAKALPAMQQSVDIFHELDQSLDPKLRQGWEEQERKAMEFRGAFLDIYNVNKETGEVSLLNKGNDHNCLCHIVVPANDSIPSTPRTNGNTGGYHTTYLWLQTGVALEVEQ
jgi:hypothetical protein